jgi:hypothetical protein
MHLHVFEHDALTTRSIIAKNSSKGANLLVLFDVFSFEGNLTAFFKKTLATSIWTSNYLISARAIHVGFHLTSLYSFTTIIFAREVSVRTQGSYVVIHID